MAKFLSILSFALAASFLLLTVLFSFMEGRLSDLFPSNEVILIIALTCLIVSLRVREFNYDDRYEILTISNPKVLFASLERQVKTDLEMPKKQIMSYRTSNYGIYKKLTIYFASYRGDFKVKHFHIYAMTSKTWEMIQNNLDVLVKTNNPENHQSNLD